MAYQPNYAKNKTNKQDTGVRKTPPVSQQPTKSGKGRLILFVLLGIIVIPVSCLLTFRMMTSVFENVGRPKPAALVSTADMHIPEQFAVAVSGRLDAVRATMRPASHSQTQQPPQTEPEETLPPVRKEYWIPEDALVAPEPDQALFGRTVDPVP